MKSEFIDDILKRTNVDKCVKKFFKCIKEEYEDSQIDIDKIIRDGLCSDKIDIFSCQSMEKVYLCVDDRLYPCIFMGVISSKNDDEYPILLIWNQITDNIYMSNPSDIPDISVNNIVEAQHCCEVITN